MWQAKARIVALDDKLQNVVFIETFFHKKRNGVWDACSVWTGAIASQFIIVSLHVDIHNIGN